MEKITRDQLMITVVILLMLLGSNGASSLWDNILKEVSSVVAERILSHEVIYEKGGK